MAAEQTKHQRLTATMVTLPPSPSVRRAAVAAAKARAAGGDDQLAAWRGWQTALDQAENTYKDAIARAIGDLEAAMGDADQLWQQTLQLGDKAAETIITAAYKMLHGQLQLADRARAAYVDPGRAAYEDAVTQADQQFKADLATAAAAFKAEHDDAVEARNRVGDKPKTS